MFEKAKSDLKDSETFKAQILYYNLSKTNFQLF